MKKITFLFLILFSLRISAQLYKCEDGTASFFSKAPLEDIDATSRHLVSAMNSSTGEIAFNLAVSSYQFKNKKMQQDFNEDFMDSDKFPFATYKGKINEKIDPKKDGTYKITSAGVLTIHGVGKQRSDTAELVIKDGKLKITGSFWVRVSDHKIKIPTLVFQKIAEVVLVKFESSYLPFKK